MSRPAGIAPVRAEYLLHGHRAAGVAALNSLIENLPTSIDSANIGGELPKSDGVHESSLVIPQSSGVQRRKLSKEEKKKRQGANKGRRYGKVRDELELCWRVAIGRSCEFAEQCRFTHDIDAYLAQKPKDILYVPDAPLKDTSPYISKPDSSADSEASINLSTVCPVFRERGECRHGLRCRFLGNHVQINSLGKVELVVDDEKVARRKIETTELNYIGVDVLKQVRSRKYPRPVTDAYLKGLGVMESETALKVEDQPDPPTEAELGANDMETCGAAENSAYTQMNYREKRRLLWHGKTYLAPLTTVGNLPFRRLCVSLGADITCGEMGLAASFLQGSKEEWSLVRRHPSESIFGVQIAGNKPNILAPAAEIIAREFSSSIDFVDLNCGCPIDLVFRSGSGSALLDTPGKLSRILNGMNKALGEIPLTVKLRTGVKDGRNTAHKIMPILGPDYGVGAASLHGRSRQQRYTKLADWDYIKECVEAIRARAADDDLPPIPIFGNGDCFSSESYWTCMEQSGVDGVMIGRGALIKPWIFTEVKERREWDISSRERLEFIRQYAEFGLNHFGSDTAGVNTTRRYLCESLSFQQRYIPIGLLEVLPGRINDRPPPFRGRNELETLLASPDSRDWVKVSEMFLGPAPENWNFIPKHKSSSYGSEESQG